MDGPWASEERKPDERGLVEVRAVRGRLDALARRALGRTSRVQAPEDCRQERTPLTRAQHRINTTLSLIEGWARTLEKHWDTLAPDTRENGLAIIRRRALDARQEVEGLILDARVEMEEEDPGTARVDVSRVLGQMVAAYRGATPAIDVSFVGQSPLYAWVNVTSLTQICSLLVDDAMRSSRPDGKVIVSAGARERSLLIRVVDHGVRLTPCVDARTRELNARAALHPAATSFGVHTARALARSMGGELTWHRGRPRGSSFEVALPLRRRHRVLDSN